MAGILRAVRDLGRKRVLVVAGLVVDGERLLLTQRRADQAMGLAWELPGGKVEPGEAPEEALVRELGEEIGVTPRVGRIWEVLFHRYPDFDLLMLIYPCALAAGDRPTCLQVKDLAWVAPAELAGYDLLPADRPLAERLLREGVPAPA